MATAKEIKPAKLCFEHIGGELGMLLMGTFIEKIGLLRANLKTRIFTLLTKGQKVFTKIGIDLSQIKAEEL